jgi:tRNA(fMet)-specific endonuclease VapC
VRYLLDTDWVIHYLNGHPEIVPRIQELSAEGIGLSLISLAELYEGMLYSRNPQRSEEGLETFLRGVELVGIDDAITRVFGRERGRLRAQGKTVGDFDLLIGATALHHGVAVLTNNRRHFELCLQPPELAIYERVSGELLSRTIWKYSEARGKFRGNPFWSRKALDHFDEANRMGEKLFRHEHVYPQVKLIEMLRQLENPSAAQLQLIYEKYAVAAVILKEQNAQLHGSGRGQRTVEGGLDNPWLRYRLDEQQILIVENELIPTWHLENLRAANLLFELPITSVVPLRPATVEVSGNRKNVSGNASVQRYYDGPFPSPNTRLWFLVTHNPKLPGTASWDRFAIYFNAKPTTVREFMTVGGTRTDIRYDLWHEYIALDPDPRMTGLDTPIKARPVVQSADRLSANSYLVKGTRVANKGELLRLLQDWLELSSVTTIGDIGTFGRDPCIFISLANDRTAVLNADTKRAAVEQYVKNAKVHGANAAWSVIPNRQGRLNKLTFREDGIETPGWYCYLRQSLSAQQKI